MIINFKLNYVFICYTKEQTFQLNIFKIVLDIYVFKNKAKVYCNNEQKTYHNLIECGKRMGHISVFAL